MKTPIRNLLASLNLLEITHSVHACYSQPSSSPVFVSGAHQMTMKPRP